MFNTTTKLFQEIQRGDHANPNFSRMIFENNQTELDLMQADLDDVQRQIDEHNESEEFIW